MTVDRLAVGDDQRQPGGRRQRAERDDEVGDPALGDEQPVDHADQRRGHDRQDERGDQIAQPAA